MFTAQFFLRSQQNTNAISSPCHHQSKAPGAANINNFFALEEWGANPFQSENFFLLHFEAKNMLKPCTDTQKILLDTLSKFVKGAFFKYSEGNSGCFQDFKGAFMIQEIKV